MPLNHQQSYLLNRLPGRYNNPKLDEDEPEPVKVQAARKTIEDWDAKQKARRAEAEKTWNSAQTAAREAIYFKPTGDALRAVQEFERKFNIVPKP